ncbi:MAG: ATP/GTP-binding protein [Chloroflexota bacterium]
MLIRFYARNYRSIDQEIELSMLPGKTRSHTNHVAQSTNRSEFSLLKTAVIYGANAAGKSNIVEAIRFAQSFIIRGTRPEQLISFQQFKLGDKQNVEPTRFEFEIQTKNVPYSYGFELNNKVVLSEWLYEISKTRSPKQIFDRTENNQESKITINKKQLKLKEDDFQFLRFIARGTRENQLFLTECRERNSDHFSDIINWFQNVLSVLPPPSISNSSEFNFGENKSFVDNLINSLSSFNIDISNIELRKMEESDDPQFNANLRKFFDISPNISDQIEIGGDNGRMIIKREQNGEVNAYKLITTRKNAKGEDIYFEFNEESDGTIRLIDLLCGFLTSLRNERVFIVDELDRSLHPILSYNFVDFFLNATSGFPNQLIVTTHESFILDLDLLRKDEIWFVEKDKTGSTNLYSLEEFTPRADKDVRRGYLQGRYGAIPLIREISKLGWIN